MGEDPTVIEMISSRKISLAAILKRPETVSFYKNNNEIVENYIKQEETVVAICMLLLKSSDDDVIKNIVYLFMSENKMLLDIFCKNKKCFQVFFSVFETDSLYKIGVVLELLLHSYAIFPTKTNSTFHLSEKFAHSILEHIHFTSVAYYMDQLCSNLSNCEPIIWFFFCCAMEHYGTGGIIPESIYFDTVANLLPVKICSNQRKSIYKILSKFFENFPLEKGFKNAVFNSLPILIEIAEDDAELSTIFYLASKFPFNEAVHNAAVIIMTRCNRSNETLTHNCINYEIKYPSFVEAKTLELMIYRLLIYKANNLVLRAFLDLANIVFPRLIKDDRNIPKQYFNIILYYVNSCSPNLTIATRAFCSNIINILKSKNAELDSEDFRLQVLRLRSIDGKLKTDKEYIEYLLSRSEEVDKLGQGKMMFSAAELWGAETIHMQRLYRNFPFSRTAKRRKQSQQTVADVHNSQNLHRNSSSDDLRRKTAGKIGNSQSSTNFRIIDMNKIKIKRIMQMRSESKVPKTSSPTKNHENDELHHFRVERKGANNHHNSANHSLKSNGDNANDESTEGNNTEMKRRYKRVKIRVSHDQINADKTAKDENDPFSQASISSSRREKSQQKNRNSTSNS